MLYCLPMSIEEIAPEALKLPLKERMLLASSLWESIGDPYNISADISDEEAIDLAVVRDAEITSGKVEAISHGQLMQRLRK